MTPTKYFRFRLAKPGESKKLTCPQCGQRTFVPYWDDDQGAIIDTSCGRCDRESKCQYHLTPREYFEQHGRVNDISPDKARRTAPERKEKALQTIPPQLVLPCLTTQRENHFMRFLWLLCDGVNLSDDWTLDVLRWSMRLGTARNGRAVFFQEDERERIRTGEIIDYEPDGPRMGHRRKDGCKVGWVHHELKKAELLPSSFDATPCLYGLHQLATDPERRKTVALVESAKSAVIGTIYFTDYIWVATGGKGNLQPERLAPLMGRKVVAFPDGDGYQEWKKKLSVLNLDVSLSDLIETQCSPAEKGEGIDIGDLLIKKHLPGYEISHGGG